MRARLLPNVFYNFSSCLGGGGAHSPHFRDTFKYLDIHTLDTGIWSSITRTTIVYMSATSFTKSITARKGLRRRVPLKAKTSIKDIKIGARRKKKKTPEQKARDRLWELCKKLTRERYGNYCYTCGKGPLAGSNWHTGHFIPSAACGAYLRYDLRNLRPQCFDCNINLGGNGADFYRNMVVREGQAYVDKLFSDKQVSVKADLLYYLNLIEEYKKLYTGAIK